MGNRFNIIRRSIFVKLMFVFLLILLLVFSVGWFNNEFASRSVANEIALSMESKVEFYMKLLELDLSKIMLPTMKRVVSAYSSFDNLDDALFQDLLRTNGERISHFTYLHDRLYITMPAPGWSYRDREDRFICSQWSWISLEYRNC